MNVINIKMSMIFPSSFLWIAIKEITKMETKLQCKLKILTKTCYTGAQDSR